MPSTRCGRNAAGNQIDASAETENFDAVSCAGWSERRSSSVRIVPPVGREVSFDDQIVPLNVWSDVSRQYDFTWLSTVKTSTPVWFRRRVLMSTSGLIVARFVGPCGP